MAITPLLRQLKEGYFLTFQSTGEDLTYTFGNSNSNNKVRFSYYALLEIPHIITSVNNRNTLQFQNVEGAFVNGLSTASPPPAGDRLDFSQSLQNYMMNLETLMINNPSYDPNTKLNISERIFWKWLKEIGGIRYRKATDTEAVINNRFVEEDDNESDYSKDLYDRVIKCVGEIDMEGSHRSGANSFREIYVYVPTNAGSTPKVLMKCVSDVNYKPAMAIRKQQPIDVEYIEGRNSDDNPTYAGLSALAIYDMDVPYGGLSYLVNNDPSQKIWFDTLATAGHDCYFTEIAFNDPLNDVIQRTMISSGQNVSYKRSRLDGVTLDFDLNNYYDIQNLGNIKSFNDYNNGSGSDSYKFNAILIYYDIFDPNNPTDKATNLYGVYFLKDIVNVSSGGAQIETYSKIKPNKTLWQQGNGYGFKINMKFDTTADNVLPEIEVSVNDYNTFSMQLFTETMARIGLALAKFETVIISNTETKLLLDELNSMILNGYNSQQIQAKLAEFDERLSRIAPGNDLLQLYTDLKTQVNNILRGNTTVGLDFFLDIKSFDGIKASLEDKMLTLRYNNQQYDKLNQINVDERLKLTPSPYNILSVGKFMNIYYHKNENIKKTAQGNISFYLDDTQFEWKTGKCLEIAFLDEIDMNGYGFIFYTDAPNRTASTDIYSKFVGVVTSQEIVTSRPNIRIICTDETKYEFIIIVK